MAQRLGMPQAVVAAARGFLSDDQKRLQAHLARIDAQARTLESERTKLDRDRRAFNETNAALSQREKTLAEREDVFKKRLNERLDERLRQAKRDVDAVIDELKEKSEALVEKASLRAPINTGESGAVRSEARSKIDQIVEDLRHPSAAGAKAPALQEDAEVGSKVALGMGLEGIVVSIDGNQAEVDVRGKRMRARLKDLQVISGPKGTPKGAVAPSKVRVNLDLKPREGMLSELNVIGMRVEEAIDRVAQFFDDTLVTDVQEVRIVHGHGTGQLRKGLHAYLKTNPLVEKFHAAPDNQGGGGATIVELKD